MKLTSLLICILASVSGYHGFGQGASINTSGASADPSAMLDVSSSKKGTLITRMTTAQRDSITSPAEGLQIYNTTSKCLQIYVYSTWQSSFCACLSLPTPASGVTTRTGTQVVWNWNTAAGATGYKYSTVNSYASATDNGTNTSYTQNGLSCSTTYTLYVWAYNNNGSCYSTTPLTLTQTTAAFSATGGAITTSGGNTIHTFDSSGTFTVNCGSLNAKVLVVGGGGAGSSGAGGAGGFLYNSSYSLTSQSYTVTIGAGGATNGANGANSVFGTMTAVGGGGGGISCGGVGSGGSGGGGGSCNGTNAPGGSGTAGQGNTGGSNVTNSWNISGGGGGAGSAGSAPANSSSGGNGGAGLSNNISGTTVYYAGGGGGSVWFGGGTTGGAGGLGGGGNGCAASPCNAGSGTPNTGGGGGGGATYANLGTGGSGVVIISYPTP